MARGAEALHLNNDPSPVEDPPLMNAANDEFDVPPLPEEDTSERTSAIRENLASNAHPLRPKEAKVVGAANDNDHAHTDSGHGHDRSFFGHLWGAGEAAVDLADMIVGWFKKWASESGGIDLGGGGHGGGGSQGKKGGGDHGHP